MVVKRRKYVIRQRPRRSVSVSIAASKKGWRTRRRMARKKEAKTSPELLFALDWFVQFCFANGAFA